MDCTNTPLIEERVSIPAADYCLEGILGYCETGKQFGVVLLIPPHPNFAGNMDNNIIRALARRFTEKGFVVLRFNFPGMGNSVYPKLAESAFDFWDRIEQDQHFDFPRSAAHVAWDYLMKVGGSDVTGRFIVGYSYGALVALLLAAKLEEDQRDVTALAAIAAPWIDRYDYKMIRHVRCPKFFVSGSNDFAFNQNIFAPVFAALDEPKTFFIADDDHFFRGNETRLSSRVSDFFANASQSMGKVRPQMETEVQP